MLLSKRTMTFTAEAKINRAVHVFYVYGGSPPFVGHCEKVAEQKSPTLVVRVS